MIPPLKPRHRIFMVLPEFRAVFVLTPKVASSAIVKAVNDYYGVDVPRLGVNIFSVMSLDEVRAYVPKWPRIMFVRNPFDRLVSCYEYHIVLMKLQTSRLLRSIGFRADMVFEEFLSLALKNTEADPHYAMQVWQSDRVDFLGRHETSAKDWDRMRSELKIPLPNLETVNRVPRSGNNYRSYFSAHWRGRVERAYGPDFKAYGYKF